MIMKYKIAVITGSRAEYGLLRPIINNIVESRNFELQLIVTGTHLSPEFGQTENEIYLDKYKISDKLETLLSSNTRSAMAKSTGLAIVSFSDSYKNLCPDLVLCLGDRYEIFAAAYSALIMNIPIAHIHGGELTYGAIDDQFRHAITKASSIHFPCTEIYKKRIMQMGEDPKNIHNVGALGVERVEKVKTMSINEMEEELGIKLSKNFFLVTVHAPTKGEDSASFLISQVTEALEKFASNSIIMSYANQDSGGYEINRIKNIFCDKKPNMRVIKKSLGHKLYINLMRNCSVVIGNSSSGVIESPILGVPSINIGNRQNGRYMADTVVQVETNKEHIVSAIKETLNKTNHDISHAFGLGKTSDLIVSHIKRFLDEYNPSNIKKFNDIDY
jgi:GDP/UDP-N,N'-diacetylbacillosamine 2-epimerase (hydrolysing)